MSEGSQSWGVLYPTAGGTGRQLLSVTCEVDSTVLMCLVSMAGMLRGPEGGCPVLRHCQIPQWCTQRSGVRVLELPLSALPWALRWAIVA